MQGGAAGVGAAIFVLAAYGCGGGASSEPTPLPEAPAFSAVDMTKPLSGADVVRGMLGDPAVTPSPPAAFTSADRRVHAVNGYLVEAIEAEAPGGLDEVEEDLASGDATRILQAMQWLDQAIADTAASPSFQAAVAGDPALGEPAYDAGTPLVLVGALVMTADAGIVRGDGGKSLTDAGDGGLVKDGGPLVCDPNNVPNLGQGSDGRYGDSRTGALGAAADVGTLAGHSPALSAVDLVRSGQGSLVADPDSRLGAYQATSGYPSDTVGNAVHNAIGTIYVSMGTFGQENIGRVFNSPEAKSLYGQPVSSCASAQMATIEQRYWQNVANEDPYSLGGKMGAAFNPATRNWLQQGWFSGHLY